MNALDRAAQRVTGGQRADGNRLAGLDKADFRFGDRQLRDQRRKRRDFEKVLAAGERSAKGPIKLAANDDAADGAGDRQLGKLSLELVDLALDLRGLKVGKLRLGCLAF